MAAPAKSQNTNVSITWLILVQLVLGYEWLNAAWAKFSSSEYLDTIGKTLGFFASPKNPHKSYTDFLHNNVLPNAHVFGQVVRLSELLAGLVLVFGGLLVWRQGMSKLVAGVLAITLILAAILNWNFYMAAGFTGPGTAGENVVMGLLELILGVFYAKSALNR